MTTPARATEPVPARSHGDTQPPPATAYVPRRGDVVSINLSPTGRAKTGRRPAVVLAPDSQDGRVLLCPIANRKGNLFGIAIPKELEVDGFILVDLLQSQDWRQRTAELITRLPQKTLAAITQKIAILERHLHRADKLRALCNSGVPAAEAWRTVMPNATKNDRSAAEQARRTIRWLEATQEVLFGKRCIGVAGRRCEQRVPSARHKFCADCGAEQHRLRRQGTNQNYYQACRDELLEEARERYHKAREAAIRQAEDEARAAIQRAEDEARWKEEMEHAAKPPTVYSKDGRPLRIYCSDTGRFEDADWYRENYFWK